MENLDICNFADVYFKLFFLDGMYCVRTGSKFVDQLNLKFKNF